MDKEIIELTTWRNNRQQFQAQRKIANENNIIIKPL